MSMSAEDRLNERPKRRRGLRRQAEEGELPMNVEEQPDDEEIGDEEEDDESSSRGLTVSKGRPTPSRRTQEIETVKHEGNILTRSLGTIRDYMEGVNSERQKIVWPTRAETRRLSYIVLTVTITASIVLGIISLIFNVVLDTGLKSPALIFGGLFILAIVVFGAYLRASNRSSGSF
jgi:preprotein translocase SecE subunit